MFRILVVKDSSMKKLLTVISLLFFCTCGTYNSFQGFYNEHKNDANVTAVTVPQFMLSLLRNSSPEMQGFMNNIRTISYMQLRPTSDQESLRINSQINNLTSTRFVEVFRKNADPIRTLISVREARDVVKEIMIYKTAPNQSSVFYLNGNFDPSKVRTYAKNGNFDQLTTYLVQQNQIDINTPIQKTN